jgi:AcrR family transcriptional regulator
LTQDLLVRAALTMIDEAGVEEFSMRALSRRLDVNPNALYWHVADLDALLGLVSAHLIASVRIPPAATPWREVLRYVGRSYRAVVAAHPRCASLLTGRLVTNSSADFLLVEALLDALHQAGIPAQELVPAYNGVVGSLAGFVGVEFAALPPSQSDWADKRRADLAGLEPDAFPRMSEVADELPGALLTRWEQGERRPLTSSFEWLLDALVAGVEARARQARPRPLRRLRP